MLSYMFTLPTHGPAVHSVSSPTPHDRWQHDSSICTHTTSSANALPGATTRCWSSSARYKIVACCREGVVGQDADLAQWLRKSCTAPVLLAANKAERRGASGGSGTCHWPCNQSLPVPLSVVPNTKYDTDDAPAATTLFCLASCAHCSRAFWLHQVVWLVAASQAC